LIPGRKKEALDPRKKERANHVGDALEVIME
jgi:hypothetical protein